MALRALLHLLRPSPEQADCRHENPPPAAGLWGAQSRSCSLPVLVEQTAEEVASAHGASVILARNGQRGERVWGTMHECSVGTVAVVMLDVGAQDLLEVATADDQQPVEALGADGADQRSA